MHHLQKRPLFVVLVIVVILVIFVV